MSDDQISFKDELTGIYTKAFFFEAGKHLMEVAIRHNASIAICVIDIDNLNMVNNKYGFTVGNQIIWSVAQTVSKKCRKSDLVGYLGEGKIGLILYNITGVNAKEMLNTLRQNIEHDINIVKQTVSIGANMIQSHNNTESIEKIFLKAYMALNDAKEKGKNRVNVY